MLLEYCGNAYAKYISGTQGAVKGVNRPEDLSLFHSLMCKNDVILECCGVWRTYTVSFTHG